MLTLRGVLDYLFPEREDWCHCDCDEKCAGKLYYCEKCGEAYCEVCVETCNWFDKRTPICDWCKK